MDYVKLSTVPLWMAIGCYVLLTIFCPRGKKA